MRIDRGYIKKLLIYLGMFSVPLIMLGFIFYYNALKIYKNQELEQNQKMLRQLKNRTEENISQFDNLALQVGYEMNKSMIGKKGFSEKDIREQLLKYKLTNPLIHEAILYYRGEDILYTSQYATTLTNFITHYYPYKNWDADDFYNDMNRISNFYIKEKMRMDGEGYDELITLIYPLIEKPMHIYGTFIILMEETRFYEIIQDSMDLDSNVFILGANNELISTLNNVEYLSNYNYLNIVEHLKQSDEEIIMIDGVKTGISYKISAKTNWKYIMLTPFKNIGTKAKRELFKVMRIMFFILIGMMIMLGSILYRHHKVVQKLYRMIGDCSLLTGEELEKKEEVYEVLSHLSVVKKRELLYQLFYEKCEQSQESYLLDELGLEVDEAHYGVAMIKGTLPDKGKGLEAFLSGQQGLHSISLILDMLPGQHVILFRCQLDDGELKPVFQLAKENFKAIEAVSIGSLYVDRGRIKKSYQEAVYGMEMLLTEGIGVINYAEILLAVIPQEYFPNGKFNELCQFIEGGQVDKTRESIQQLFQYFREKQTPLHVKKSVIYMMLGRVSMTDHRISEHYNSEKIHKMMMKSMDNKEELENNLKTIAVAYSKANQKKTNSDELIVQMKQYVEDNTSNPDFSITMMASHFAVSPSYLSRFFKKYMDMTAQEYLQQCRVEKAKGILTSTNLTLQEISEQVGYHNVSSFIRIFKKYTEITPGQYRKQQP